MTFCVGILRVTTLSQRARSLKISRCCSCLNAFNLLRASNYLGQSWHFQKKKFWNTANLGTSTTDTPMALCCSPKRTRCCNKGQIGSTRRPLFWHQRPADRWNVSNATRLQRRPAYYPLPVDVACPSTSCCSTATTSGRRLSKRCFLPKNR